MRIDPVPAPKLEYGAIPVKDGVIMYPEGYSGEGNGLFYDYQDAVRHIRELKLLRIQNQEMIRLLKEIE